MSAIKTRVDDDVLVIVIDLPGESVNKITREVREELDAILTSLPGRADVKSAVLISGKPDNFIAGADIDEFVTLGTEEAVRELVENGHRMINALEASPKPIVAAIDGACLGGGLEISLACAGRIATSNPKTALGLPEVQLGLIPGAGGCQRLPRIIGLRPALDIILAGKSVNGKKALRLGLIDDLVHPAQLEEVAVEMARKLSVRRFTRKKPGSWIERTPPGRALISSMAKKAVLKKTGGNYPAPLAALDAITTGLSRGMTRGLQREADHFSKLAAGDVSRRLIEIFFATTALKKDFGVEGDVKPDPVESLGIVGAGFMGAGIGTVAALKANVDVRFQESEWERIGAGIGHARAEFKKRLKRRRLSKYEFREIEALVSGTTDWAGFERPQIVVEAVFEDLDVKKDVFRKLEAETNDRCVLASNTSTIPISRIAEAVSCPERVIGMHFFSPVEKMPLLEVITTDVTAPRATATAVAFGRKMGKTVIVVKDSPGFWVNRILTPYMNEAGRLLEEGAAIEDLDRSMTRFGFPVGPITLLDEVGLDIGVKASSVMHAAFGDRMEPRKGMQALVDSGRLGRKNGKGFFVYEKGKRKGVDSSVYSVIRNGNSPGPSSDDIHARLVYSMLNEAALALQEGVVGQPRDGDIGAIFGIGYPPFLGGPLRHTDTLGADTVVKALEGLAERFGDRFRPAEILAEHARSGGSFY